MEKTTKILVVVFLVFLLVNAGLGLRYWSLTKSQKAEYSPTPCETPEITPTTLIPPPGKLINPLIAGITHHKVGDRDIYEIIGWVMEANEQKQEIGLGQKDGSPPHGILVPQSATIRLVSVDENGKLQHQPKTFTDLIPGKVRVSILCRDSGCSEAEIVSIIETQNL